MDNKELNETRKLLESGRAGLSRLYGDASSRLRVGIALDSLEGCLDLLSEGAPKESNDGEPVKLDAEALAALCFEKGAGLLPRNPSLAQVLELTEVLQQFATYHKKGF